VEIDRRAIHQRLVLVVVVLVVVVLVVVLVVVTPCGRQGDTPSKPKSKYQIR
jgi:ABC-type transporter Mla subunit MlaD